MHPNYTIRPALPADVPALPEIELRAGTLFEKVGWPPMAPDDVHPIETLETAQAAGRLWVAADNESGHPVGFALATIVEDHAHLQELDVHPDHMRRGLGRALVEAVCAWTKDASLSSVTLTTERDLPWNAPAYLRMGFEIVPPTEWTAALHDIVEEERGRNMDPATRVVMRRKV